jgi:hypothetical protein
MCQLFLSTENGLRNHIANKFGHQRYCWPCQRWFVDDTALEQHETDLAHQEAVEQEPMHQRKMLIDWSKRPTE